MELVRSFLRPHFTGKPVVVKWTVGSFQQLQQTISPVQALKVTFIPFLASRSYKKRQPRFNTKTYLFIYFFIRLFTSLFFLSIECYIHWIRMINFCDHSPRLVFTSLNIFTYANNSIFTPLNFICLEIFYGISNRQFYTIFISRATKYIVSSTSWADIFFNVFT